MEDFCSMVKKLAASYEDLTPSRAQAKRKLKPLVPSDSEAASLLKTLATRRRNSRQGRQRYGRCDESLRVAVLAIAVALLVSAGFIVAVVVVVVVRIAVVVSLPILPAALARIGVDLHLPSGQCHRHDVTRVVGIAADQQNRPSV